MCGCAVEGVSTGKCGKYFTTNLSFGQVPRGWEGCLPAVSGEKRGAGCFVPQYASPGGRKGRPYKILAGLGASLPGRSGAGPYEKAATWYDGRPQAASAELPYLVRRAYAVCPQPRSDGRRGEAKLRTTFFAPLSFKKAGGVFSLEGRPANMLYYRLILPQSVLLLGGLVEKGGGGNNEISALEHFPGRAGGPAGPGGGRPAPPAQRGACRPGGHLGDPGRPPLCPGVGAPVRPPAYGGHGPGGGAGAPGHPPKGAGGGLRRL